MNDEEIDYELATEKQINWLHRHHYYDTEKMSKQMASDIIEQMIKNKGRIRSLWEEYID